MLIFKQGGKMKLKDLRLQNNLKQEDLAKVINKSAVAYGYYENGSREPDIKTLTTIADFYNVSLDYLCDRQWDNKAYIEVWKLSEEQKANLYLIEKLTPKNNLRANGYLLGLFQEQQTSKC